MSDTPLGLISAIPQELAHFGTALELESSREIAGIAFKTGRLDGLPVVAVEAGLGKVNAALVSTLLLAKFGCRGLIFSGVAGGLDPALQVGDVVLGKRLICHDYGRLSAQRIVTYQPGNMPLPGCSETHGYDLPPELLTRIRQVLSGFELPKVTAEGGGARRPRLIEGTILTGDTFLSCAATRIELAERFAGQAVEMEGAAVAQVAERFEKPAIVIRALSDLAGEESHLDFGRFLEDAAGSAARIVRRILPAI
ncbi:MAG: 5'-methylthioadenosine/adenosylhomocysteine nucleosidase [Rhodovibrionaceae bacterium]